MGIHPGEAQVIRGEGAQTLVGSAGRNRAGRHVGQEPVKLRGVHIQFRRILVKAREPAYLAASARSASIRSSWLYLATRSVRAGAPVLIWPALVATARSAMVVSSLSPERCEMTAVNPARCAMSMASSVSLSVPIWLTLIRIELPAPRSINGLAQAVGVGDQQVVADQLHAVADGFRERAPAVPVILAQPVFDRHDGEALDPLGPQLNQFGSGQRAAFLREHVATGIIHQLGGGGVDRQKDVTPGFVAGPVDSFEDDLEGSGIGSQAGRESPLVAHAGSKPSFRQHVVELVIDLDRRAQRFGERSGGYRHHHEFLKVGAAGGVNGRRS